MANRGVVGKSDPMESKASVLDVGLVCEDHAHRLLCGWILGEAVGLATEEVTVRVRGMNDDQPFVPFKDLQAVESQLFPARKPGRGFRSLRSKGEAADLTGAAIRYRRWVDCVALADRRPTLVVILEDVDRDRVGDQDLVSLWALYEQRPPPLRVLIGQPDPCAEGWLLLALGQRVPKSSAGAKLALRIQLSLPASEQTIPAPELEPVLERITAARLPADTKAGRFFRAARDVCASVREAKDARRTFGGSA